MQYDSPFGFYDASNAFYDMPTESSKMKPVNTGMTGLTEAQRLVRAQEIITLLTGNAFFPTLNPLPATVQTHIDEAVEKASDAAEANAAARLANQQRRDALAVVISDINQLAANVANVANGNVEMILSSGFYPRETPTPPTIPPAPLNVRVAPGEFPGEFLVRWEASKDAVIYYLQTSGTPTDEASWVDRGSSTRTSTSLKGLVSGASCWVRVAGDGPAGQGPWSNPTQKIVP